jgi:hypothetical protein
MIIPRLRAFVSRGICHSRLPSRADLALGSWGFVSNVRFASLADIAYIGGGSPLLFPGLIRIRRLVLVLLLESEPICNVRNDACACIDGIGPAGVSARQQ